MGCQRNNGSADSNSNNQLSQKAGPFLLLYLRNFPTIRIDTSENVAVQRISYSDFDRREVHYGDGEPSTSWHDIFVFQNGIFYGIETVLSMEGMPIRRYQRIDILRDQNGLVRSIDEHPGPVLTGHRPVRQHTYAREKNITIANNRLNSGAAFAVFVEEESRFLFWGDYQRYLRTPDRPDRIIEFINYGDVIITDYNFIFQRIGSRFHFVNGVLMKREYHDRTETYTVRTGIGEIVVTNPAGDVIERRMLERRKNDDGFLEFEAVRFEAGTGFKFSITRDTFN